MTFDDYDILQEIKREDEEAQARQRIAERQRAREERKLRRIFFLGILAAVCVMVTWAAVRLDNSGDDPTRDLPLQTAEPAEEPPVVHGVDVLGEFAIVAYCACEECCGEWALDRPLDENGEPIVYTASGEEAKAGVTVAVDPDVIPLGSKVYIEELGWYVAQDTGNFSGKVIDVYMKDHAAACEFGRRDAVVGIVED